MPVSTFIMVLLPEPLGPMSPWMVPGETERSTSFSALRPPNCITTPLASMSAWPSRSAWSGFAQVCTSSPRSVTSVCSCNSPGFHLRTSDFKYPVMPSGR